MRKRQHLQPLQQPARQAGPTAGRSGWEDYWRLYLETTPQRIRLVDAFVASLVALTCIQLVNFLLGSSRWPLHAFLSGVFASGGVAVFAVVLRTQLEEPKSFPGSKPQAAFSDFLLCSFVLLAACLNYLG